MQNRIGRVSGDVQSPRECRVICMTKPKSKKSKKAEIVRFSLSDDAMMMLTELAGPNAVCVMKAMSPAYSGNPEFNKFKVG